MVAVSTIRHPAIYINNSFTFQLLRYSLYSILQSHKLSSTDFIQLSSWNTYNSYKVSYNYKVSYTVIVVSISFSPTLVYIHVQYSYNIPTFIEVFFTPHLLVSRVYDKSQCSFEWRSLNRPIFHLVPMTLRKTNLKKEKKKAFHFSVSEINLSTKASMPGPLPVANNSRDLRLERASFTYSPFQPNEA